MKAELGQNTYQKTYPILIDFGDDILFEENTPRLEKALAHLMTKDVVQKCHTWFTLIVFHAMEARDNGGGDGGLLIAMQTLKNINTTACFGNFD